MDPGEIFLLFRPLSPVIAVSGQLLSSVSTC